MYDVQCWITAVNSGQTLDIDTKVPSSPDVHHPSNSYRLHVTPDVWEEGDDKSEYRDGLSTTFDASAWLTHHMPSLLDCGSDSTATSAVSDSDAMAQFIDIAWDSPWYRLPQPNSPFSTSPLHDSYSCACSPDVRQAMAQQDLLLDLFHKELRRIIPSDHRYDCDWLEDVDPDLVLSPVQSYEELCWQEGTSETHMIIQRQPRPLPDVPVGCGDPLDGAFFA